MSDSRKIVIRQTLIIFVSESFCTGIMYGIYALLQRFNISVLLSGIVGTVLATGNYFFMAVVATLAADRAEKQDVTGGKRMMQASYPLRLIVLAGILLLCGFSGFFDPLALALPLAFVRPALIITAFIRRGDHAFG